MPIYGYRCEACGVEIEKRQGFHDDPLTTCDACGGVLRRILHPVGIVFKGSGFYNTDNRKSANKSASPSSSGENGKTSSESSSSDASSTSTEGTSSKPDSAAPASPTPAGS